MARKWFPQTVHLYNTAIKQIYDSFEDKIRELDFQESNNQENVLEESQAFLNYTKVKKKNLMDSHLVFKALHQDKIFRNKFLRFQNVNQVLGGLPIYAKKMEILDKYPESQVLIIKSTAGSGKSTQMPQYLLECARGRILVTQPRVIAAESVAKRVQEVVGFY